MLRAYFLFLPAVLACALLTLAATSALAQDRQEVNAALKQGHALRDQFRHAEALSHYERALRLAEQIEGEDSTLAALCLYFAAGAHRELNHFSKAESLYNRSLHIYEAKLGKDCPDVADCLNNLAILYRDMGQNAKAEPLHRRSLEIREAKLGPDHPDVAYPLNNLALLYSDMGQYAQAEPLYQRSLKILEAKLGLDHPLVASSLNNLAGLYHDMGQNAKAEPLHRRSLEIREAKLGPDHPDVATSLNNLALLYRALGQNAKAEPLYRRSLEILETKLGPDHPDVATSLNNLAVLYSDMGQHAKAEPLYRRSLEIREAKLGKDHPDVGLALNNLAILYLEMGQYAKAEPLYRRSLEIHEAKLGPDHPNVATSLNNLANLYSDMGQYAKAEPLYRRSLEIREAKLGKDHPDVALSLNNLAWLQVGMKEWPKAMDGVTRARRVLARHIAGVLPFLPEAEQTVFLKEKVAWNYHRALSLGLWRGEDEAAAAASAAWLLNGKGLTYQALAEQNLLARDAKDPQARALAAQLKQTRASLAALLQRDPKAGQEEAYRQQRQALQQREQELARKLAQAGGRPFRADPWVALDEVRTKLDQKAVLIDIARFPVCDFGKKKLQPARYVAWITPPAGKGEVRIIDLGDAEAIDQAVKAARLAITRSADNIPTKGEAAALLETVKPLAELAQKVLHPMHQAIAGYDEWIICPDGALWLVPWSALPLADGKYALEKHLIRHVISGRDLVMDTPKGPTTGAHLFADPDFDLSPGAVTAKARGVLRGLGMTPAPVVPTLAGRKVFGTIGSWNVSFEFGADGQMVIRDQDGGGRLAGQGSWNQEGTKVTAQSATSRYEGTLSGSRLTGRRLKKDDSSAGESWQLQLPAGELAWAGPLELRGAGAASTLLPAMPPLPGTAKEAQWVQPHLQELTGMEPRLFLGGEAAEGVVKAVRRPRILMLATHGYFLPAQEIEVKEHQPLAGQGKRSGVLRDQQGQEVENPLLRCGLLLAGANKRGQAQPGDEDGILSGLEIVGLDLRGCELVVLSACETAVGEVRHGEGVACLRQAFQLAGAQAVLASLWPMEDRETANLMKEFFSNLAQGQGRAQALRNAQLRRIAARRADGGAAHPFFWAAFALTGK